MPARIVKGSDPFLRVVEGSAPAPPRLPARPPSAARSLPLPAARRRLLAAAAACLNAFGCSPAFGCSLACLARSAAVGCSLTRPPAFARSPAFGCSPARLRPVARSLPRPPARPPARSLARRPLAPSPARSPAAAWGRGAHNGQMDLLTAIRERDHEALEAMVADDVVFNSPTTTYRGRDQVVEVLAVIGSVLEDVTSRARSRPSGSSRAVPRVRSSTACSSRSGTTMAESPRSFCCFAPLAALQKGSCEWPAPSPRAQSPTHRPDAGPGTPRPWSFSYAFLPWSRSRSSCSTLRWRSRRTRSSRPRSEAVALPPRSTSPARRPPSGRCARAETPSTPRWRPPGCSA